MEGTPFEGLRGKQVIAMNLSIEARVAAAVAVAFAVLSMGAIAREQSDRGTTGSNGYVATENPGPRHLTARGSNSSTHTGTAEGQLLAKY